MKKRHVFVGLLGVIAGTAHAQSSVTLYGLIDEGLQFNTNNKVTVNGRNVGGRQYTLDSLSGPFGSRWGMRGREDLGGGLSAIFILESGVNLNTGAFGQGGTLFGRTALVGLKSDKFGQVNLGRQYDSVNDYLGALGFGLADYGSGVSHPGDLDNLAHTYRANNTIKYISPNFAGLSFGGTVSAGGVAGEVSQNSGVTFGAGYVGGPLSLGVAYQFFKNPSAAGSVLNSNSNAVSAATTTNYNSLNSGYLAGTAPANSWQVIGAGGSYTIGPAVIAAVYTNIKYQDIGRFNGATATFNDVEVNARYRFNPEVFAAVAYNYTKGNAVTGQLGNQKYHQVSAIADYSLSKRTDLYVVGTVQQASGTNSTGTAAVADISNFGDSSNNRQAVLRLGFRHRF
jgi:predicted porin